MSEHAIHTTGLEKRYGSLLAVNGLEMKVPRGAVYGFLGRNGAGKTTTIKMLLVTFPGAGGARAVREGLDGPGARHCHVLKVRAALQLAIWRTQPRRV